jgi:hypothetical protein
MNAITFETAVSADHQLHFELPASLPVGSKVRVTVESVTGDPLVDHYQPRTELGRKLIELRRAYVQGGGKLLTWQELDEEMQRRRGGVADE